MCVYRVCEYMCVYVYRVCVCIGVEWGEGVAFRLPRTE